MESVVGESKKYRLRFSSQDINEPCISFDIFVLPSGMMPEQAFLILSFLVERIYQEYGYEPYSLENISLVNLALFRDYAFESVSEVPDDFDVVELFTIENRLNRMGYDRVTKSCFEWYTPNVRDEEIKAIYSSLEKNHPRRIRKPKSNVA